MKGKILKITIGGKEFDCNPSTIPDPVFNGTLFYSPDIPEARSESEYLKLKFIKILSQSTITQV